MSNLLKDASILLTPTAYENGRMNATKPYKDLYGPDIVVNGGFDTSSNWTIVSGSPTISGGKLNIVSSSDKVRQSLSTLNTSKVYKVEFTISNYTSGGALIKISNSATSATFSSNGTHTFFLSGMVNNALDIVGVSVGGTQPSFSIDNVSVVEDLSGDFTFSRSSAATRVNAQGLVENVQIISSELVSNGNFSQIGTEEVSNGNFSQEGSELVTNGDFATDSDWNKGTGWSIANGSANSDGTNNYDQLRQTNILTIGNSYKLTFDLTYISGLVKFTTPSVDSEYNSSGSYTLNFIADSANVVFTAWGAFTGSIDNVSVKEVGQDWNLGNKWSIGENSAIRVPNSTSNLSQVISGISGKTIKVSYAVSNYVSGDIGASADGNNYNANNGNGTFVEYITPTSDNFYLRASYSFEGSISNISVKEVGQDWTFGTGWSVDQANSKAVHDSSAGATAIQSTSVSVVVGKKYELKYTASNLSGGYIRAEMGGLTPEFNFSDGTYTYNFTATTNANLYITASANVEVTNISVKEITDDTDLPRINYEGFSYQDSLGSEEIVNGDFATDSNWNKDDSWTISGGTANYNYISGRNMNSSSAALVVGKTYKLVYTILNYSSGYVINDSAETRPQRNSNGTYTEVFTARYTFFRLRGSVSGEFSIDNVSVKEVLGQEVVPDSGCGSWLLEPQSTNLVTYSEDFSQWNSDKTTPTLNSATSPSGDVNSAKLTSTGVYGSLNLTISKSSSALNYTQSVFIKAVNYSIVNLISYGSSSANRAQVSFDLSDGSVSTAASVNGAYSNPSESIQDYGNGWYRISLSFTSDTSVEVRPHIQFPAQMTSSDYVLLWGAQLEAQSYATSYIPTNGATNTRLQDIATNSGNSTLINSTEGVLYAEIAALADDNTNRYITISDGSNSNYIRLVYSTTSNQLGARYYVNGSFQCALTYILADETEFIKAAFKWKENDFALWVNGTEVATDTSGLVNAPNTFNRLDFSRYDGIFPFNGKAKALAVFPILTNAQLQSLTTQ